MKINLQLPISSLPIMQLKLEIGTAPIHFGVYIPDIVY